MNKLNEDRRDFLKMAAVLPATAAGSWALAQAPAAAPAAVATGDIAAQDRVFITNEDSNTISVINPATNTVDTTINLTSFDEDARPPFRYVTGGVMPPHAAMIHKPLYHGCIDAHGAVPNPGCLISSSTFIIRSTLATGNSPSGPCGLMSRNGDSYSRPASITPLVVSSETITR